MKSVTCFAFIQNVTLEKKVIDCLSRFQSIHFFGFVNHRVDFLERINHFRPEILIIDLSQRKNEEVDILGLIHKPPIILGIISSKENPHFWLDKGLFDVLPVQFSNDLLIRKIYKILRLISDINSAYQLEPIAAENPIPFKSSKSSLTKENDSFFVRYQKVTTKIKPGIITIITKEKKFIVIETSTNQLYFHEATIKETAMQLPAAYFVRINNATIINLNYVDKNLKNLAYMGERVFTVSRSYYYQFRKALDALQKKL
ncbi:MAG: LytTR family transcriptional regulator DNA-binding domain-containing protein [Bacteroidetes bacterium]|nr:LytTR family transcriptional regulator DNA-binding domain-containing protein [Bacteroidota bacterium]MCL1968580.1 LytTR family transcriptional regulator DNA-binding domain-containing protein [Bacteroidota bacterium]